MSNLVPDGWKEVKFKDVFHGYKYGPRFSSKDYDESGNVKTIRGTDVDTSGVIKYPQVPTARLDSKLVDDNKLLDGDLVMITTADCGMTAVFYEQAIPYIASAYAIKLSPTDQVSSEFMKLFMQTSYAKTQIESFVRKGTVANLPGSDVMNVAVKLPPLYEQQKIARILTSVDEVIEKTQAQIDKLKNLKTGMMQELLTNGIGHTEFKDSSVGRIPAEWDVRKFGDITLEHKQGFYSKDKYTADGTYLIRITDMQNPYISFTEMPKMVISDKDKEAYKVLNGDFLFARSGAIGRYGIFDSNNEAVFASYLIRFRFNLEKALNEFVGFWYESDVCQKQLGTITQGSSNININAQNIKELKIPIPPINEQKKITQAILSIVKKTICVERKLNSLKNKKKALMQDLLTGKVRVDTELTNTEVAVG
jgi:type I restriction enzyme S subunit